MIDVNDTNSFRRWRIFQLMLSTSMLFLEILNVIFYGTFNTDKTDIEWNYEFETLRDKNRFIVLIIFLPTTIVSIILLVYVLYNGESLTIRRKKLLQKSENIDLYYIRQETETSGILNKLISYNINSILLFGWSITVILNMILFGKNWDLMCKRLDEAERSSNLCNDFTISLVLNILLFLSCIFITFMKLLYSNPHKENSGELYLET